MVDGPEWFTPKHYGYGSGLPIAWQGWVVLLLYLALVVGSMLLLGERNPASYAILIGATLALLFVTMRTTKGRWRWRWGKED